MGVFVCDDTQDAGAVELLVSDLRCARQQVVQGSVFDSDEAGWAEALAQIRGCDVFIFAMSEHALGSRTCMVWYEYAKALQRPIIPVRVGTVDNAITNPLSSLQHVYYRPPTVNSGIELTAALHDHLSQPSPLPDTMPPPPESPFGYLDRLTDEVGSPGLPGQRQTDMLAELDAHLKRDGNDPAVRRRVVDVLTMLLGHPGLRARLRPQVEERLAAISAGIGASSAGPARSRLVAVFRRKRFLLGTAAAGVLAIALFAALVWWPEPEVPSGGTAVTQQEPTTPQSETVTLMVLSDSILIGSSNAATVIDLYNEPICGGCGDFISSYMDDLERALRAQKIAVRFHILNTMDENSASGDYSTRAAAAVYCVAAARDVGLFEDFYTALFAPEFQPQPAPAPDRTRVQLADLAESVAAPASVVKCIESDEEIGSAAARSDAAHGKLTEVLRNEQPTFPRILQGNDDVTIVEGWVNDLVS